MLKWLLATLLLGHGAIHLLGFASAVGWTVDAKLHKAVSPSFGLLWLLAALLLVGAAALRIFDVQRWWALALPGVVTSQVLVIVWWSDAKWGAMPNLLIGASAILAMASFLPGGFRSQFLARSQIALRSTPEPTVVAESELAPLPPPVQRYLRFVGVVGKPRAENFEARMGGEMVLKKGAPPSPIRATQYSFRAPAKRLFHIEASLYGVPFDGLHAYEGGNARMAIRVASVFPIVDAGGEKMTQSETVTMFNDMCLMAPSMLLDPAVEWEPIDDLHAHARFTNAGHTISARLTFREDGALVDFVSNDRHQSEDGKTYRSFPWSTPIGSYDVRHGFRLPSQARAVWKEPGEDFVYADFQIHDIRYNVHAARL